MRPDKPSESDATTPTTAGEAQKLRDVLGRLRSVSDAERALQVADLERRRAEGRLRVLLVGEAKRGKSTLGNALLGRAVLPTAVAPLTAINTTVRIGSPERVEVLLVDGRLLTTPLQDLASFVTEAGNPVNERGVADVTAFVDTAIPVPDIELVDTPGVGSVFEHNTTEADAALTRMDVALVVLTADPPISSSERELLRHARRLSVRTLVVLNKVDRMTSSERREVEQFTADVVNQAVGSGEVDVFACSASIGLKARLDHDDIAWASSGMKALSDVLWSTIRESGSADLVASLAGSARRITEDLLDETTLTIRARELLAEERSDRIHRFLEGLDAMETRRDEALAVARGEALTQRTALDESATSDERQLIRAALNTLTDALRDIVGVDRAQLEARGAAVLREFVRSEVDVWREQHAHELDAALQRLSGRQQELVEHAVGEVREIARETLGVHLTASAQTVRLPASSGFSYTFGPEAGWNEPVTSAVRRHLPGGLGRRRVTTHLRYDAERLVAKHMGRSRSDLQRRLEEAMRTLTASVGRTFTQHAEHTRAAVQAASAPAGSGLLYSGEGLVSGEFLGESAVAELQSRAAELLSILRDLHAMDGQPIGNDRAQGGRDGPRCR